MERKWTARELHAWECCLERSALRTAAKDLIAAIEDRTDKSAGSPFARESNALRAAVAKMETC